MYYPIETTLEMGPTGDSTTRCATKEMACGWIISFSTFSSCLAVGEPLVGVSIGMKRARQQNDSLANGYRQAVVRGSPYFTVDRGLSFPQVAVGESSVIVLTHSLHPY